MSGVDNGTGPQARTDESIIHQNRMIVCACDYRKNLVVMKARSFKLNSVCDKNILLRLIRIVSQNAYCLTNFIIP